MATLTTDQLGFLQSQRIPLSMVFDATGMKQAEYRKVMSALGLPIAYGVGPCAAAGHTLRTRAGHCAQCNTAVIAFMRRNDETAHVYVAHSAITGLVKVGLASDVHERIATLRNLGYGGVTDWVLRHGLRCPRAGSVEFAVHAELESRRARRSYARDGMVVECRELFECSPEEACRVLDAMLQRHGRARTNAA